MLPHPNHPLPVTIPQLFPHPLLVTVVEANMFIVSRLVCTRLRAQERRRHAPGLAKVEKAVQERAGRIEALQTRIHEVQDRIFGAFSKKVRIRTCVPTSCVPVGKQLNFNDGGWAIDQRWIYPAVLCSY